MKMAAFQLMQQKANRDSKMDVAAITESSDTTPNKVDIPQTLSASSDSHPVATDSKTSAASQETAEGKENSSRPTTNGPLDSTTTQNGECKNPLEGKELEDSIPGLAQAKELAETLVAEDGTGIGTSKLLNLLHLARSLCLSCFQWGRVFATLLCDKCRNNYF